MILSKKFIMYKYILLINMNIIIKRIQYSLLICGRNVIQKLLIDGREVINITCPLSYFSFHWNNIRNLKSKSNFNLILCIGVLHKGGTPGSHVAVTWHRTLRWDEGGAGRVGGEGDYRNYTTHMGACGGSV